MFLSCQSKNVRRHLHTFSYVALNSTRGKPAIVHHFVFRLFGSVPDTRYSLYTTPSQIPGSIHHSERAILLASTSSSQPKNIQLIEVLAEIICKLSRLTTGRDPGINPPVTIESVTKSSTLASFVLFAKLMTHAKIAAGITKSNTK